MTKKGMNCLEFMLRNKRNGYETSFSALYQGSFEPFIPRNNFEISYFWCCYMIQNEIMRCRNMGEATCLRTEWHQGE